MFDRSHYSFTIPENQPLATRIGQVSATDPDYMENGTPVYSLVDNSQFSINHQTGVLRTAAMFDREMQETYILIVQARDNGISPRHAEPITVTIVILDENDNDPLFQPEPSGFTIDTNHKPGDEVGTITATDIDEAPNNIIVYKMESPSAIFSMPNGSTGTITIQRTLGVDDEGLHQLSVSAFNPGRESLKDTVRIFIAVNKADPFTPVVIRGIAGGATAFLVILMITVVLFIMCFYSNNRKYQRRYEMEVASLRNTILKIPSTDSDSQHPQGEVTFNKSVPETHFNTHTISVIRNGRGNGSTIAKSVSSTQEHRSPNGGFCKEEDVSATPTPGHYHHHRSPPTKHSDLVQELEVGPTGDHMINEDAPLSHYNHDTQTPRHLLSPMSPTRDHMINEDGPLSLTSHSYDHNMQGVRSCDGPSSPVGPTHHTINGVSPLPSQHHNYITQAEGHCDGPPSPVSPTRDHMIPVSPPGNHMINGDSPLQTHCHDYNMTLGHCDGSPSPVSPTRGRIDSPLQTPHHNTEALGGPPSPVSLTGNHVINRDSHLPTHHHSHNMQAPGGLLSPVILFVGEKNTELSRGTSMSSHDHTHIDDDGEHTSRQHSLDEHYRCGSD